MNAMIVLFALAVTIALVWGVIGVLKRRTPSRVAHLHEGAEDDGVMLI
ncbi:MAG: hypothetical protein KatS3mg053_2627 [Candidatus Roseilinea sp.]|nr:MAG: hypothetical protein KatS3mg053_2627 [Candidatus Roseilinea sp.]